MIPLQVSLKELLLVKEKSSSSGLYLLCWCFPFAGNFSCNYFKNIGFWMHSGVNDSAFQYVVWLHLASAQGKRLGGVVASQASKSRARRIGLMKDTKYALSSPLVQSWFFGKWTDIQRYLLEQKILGWLHHVGWPTSWFLLTSAMQRLLQS